MSLGQAVVCLLTFWFVVILFSGVKRLYCKYGSKLISTHSNLNQIEIDVFSTFLLVHYHNNP